MYHKIKRFTALLVCLTLLFSVVPAGTYADVMSSAWVDPTSGMELVKAETYHTSDEFTVVLYKGETSSIIDETSVVIKDQQNSDDKVADVNFASENTKTIEIVAKEEGFTTFSYDLTYTKDDKTIEEHGSIVVRVIEPTLSIAAPATATPDTTAALTITVNRKPIDSNNDITWRSSDESIATVDATTGEVTFHSAGSVTITASTKITMNNIQETLESSVIIEVKSGFQSLTLSPETLNLFVGDTASVTISGAPENYLTDEGKITVRSTNPTVVEVSRDGANLSLIAKEKGSAVVIVSCEGVRKLLRVTVDQYAMRVQPENLEIIEGSTYTVVSKINPVSSGDEVQVTVANQDIASAIWIGEGENLCLVKGLAAGETEVTFTLPYTEGNEAKILTQTIHVKVVADENPDEQSYTISFVDYDGTLLLTKQAKVNEEIFVPNVESVREGYQFEGFLPSNSADQTKYGSGDTLIVTGDMVLEAQYALNQYKIIYQQTELSEKLNQSLPAEATVSYGELLPEPEYGLLEVETAGPEGSGEKRYYRFDGWKIADSDQKWDFSQPVTDDMTLEPIWNMVEVDIILRTFKGNYRTFSVPKGSTNVEVNNIPKFTYWGDPDYYSYTYVNKNGVGKVVEFRHWQHGNNQITYASDQYTISYTIEGPVVRDEIITAVYEPGPWGPNRVVSTYYHSTNVYVPVDYVVKNTGETVHSEMELTDVYPLYRVTTSPVYGIEYQISEPSDISNLHDNMEQLNPDGGTYIYRCLSSDPGYQLSYDNTAKFGRVDLSYHVGQEFKTSDGRVYLITGIDQETVETVWMCDMLGHVFNGYCVGGTWNALGQVTLYLEEKTEDTCKIKVNYYVLPAGWKTGDSLENADLQLEEATVLSADQLLAYQNYVDDFGSLYPNVAYEWVTGAEGDLTVENDEYELNLYYANVTYNLTVNYYYRTADGTGEEAAPSHQEGSLSTNESYSVPSPVVEGYVADKPVVQGTIINQDVVVDVYYERPVSLNYQALKGGTVIRTSETVNEFTGVAAGSVAVPEDGYVFVGWYYDEECTKPVEDEKTKFVPQKENTYPDGVNDNAWHETTFYAKFQNAAPIVIESADGEWKYDGETHFKPEYTVTYDGQKIQPDEGTTNVFTLPTGDTLTVTPTEDAHVTNVSEGKVKNSFTYELENKDNYADVNTEFGDLTITPKPVTVTLTGNTITETYDGTPQTVNGYTVEISDPNYTETDFTYTGTSVATGTNVGEYPMELDEDKLTNKNPNYDVTFETIPGKLKIEPVQLKITSENGTWQYDGEEHTQPVYTVTYGGQEIEPNDGTTNVFTLPTGDKLTVTPTGDACVTNVSDSKADNNTFTYVLENEGNYTEVETEFGDLSITPKPVTVTLTGNTKTETYDGTSKTVNGYTVEINDPNYTEADFTYTGTSVATGTNVGEYPMELDEDKLTNENPNYDVTFETIPGKLKIEPEQLKITSADGTWQYDGEEHTQPVYTVTYGGQEIEPDEGTTNVFTLPTGDKLTVTPTGDACVTNVSDSKEDNNTFTYVLENEGNYAEVETEFGDLTITPKPVTVTLTGNTKTETYDGTPKTVNGYTVEISDPNYTEADFTYTGTSVATGTNVGEYPMELDKDKVVNKNPNYDVTFETIPGELTIIAVDLVVTKTSDKTNKKVAQGEKITYTITVENKSSLLLTNVKVDDEKTGLHEVIPLMLPGAKNEFTTTWTVTEQDVLAGKILNSVTAKADPITNPQDPDHPFVPQGEADVTDTPVDVAVELVVVKTSDKEGRRVAEGETITYTIIVKNKGNVTLHQVKVDDEKTGLHTVVASLAPGAMKEFTTTWTVTEADVNAGKILNSVTAKANPVKDPKNPKVPIVPQDTDTVEDKAARTPHRVTVNYYLDSIGGETVAPQVVQVHYAGDDFSIESPVIPGYTASIEVVEGTMGSGDVVYNVIYTPTVYQLTIKYVDADGNPVQPPYQDGLKAGESYSSNSPSVDGMICTRPVVDGIMPDYDLEIVVIYLDAEQYVVVDEPAAPKGIGTVTLNAGDCFE